MSEKLKIWELVKAIEEDTENASQRYAEVRATMIANFGPETKISEYKDVVSVGDNLGYMVTLGFSHMHHMIKDRDSRINELTTWLKFLLRYAPEKENENSIDIKQVIKEILEKPL